MVLFIFILGLSIGSFLNVLIDRLPRNESILGRSYCESCKKSLSWKDLIPVLSFIYLRGRCRYCRTPFSYNYPLVELLTGVLFVFTYLYLNKPISNFQFPPLLQGFAGQAMFNFSPDPIYSLLSTLYYLIVVSSLIVIFFADLKYGIIPDKIVFPAIIVSFAYLFITHPPAGDAGNSLILNHLLSALGDFLFFLFIYLITKGKGMGLGDVKLAFLMGLVLGFPGTVLALYIAFLTGGFIGIILILWKKKKVKIRNSVWPVFSKWVPSRFIFSRSNNTADNTGSTGFTLIEVLIVIGLIGILSAAFLVLVNPKAQLEKARDSQRRSHLRQIQSALEVYRADCGAYPDSLGTSLTASCNSSSVTYMQTVPTDPSTGSSYYYCTTAGLCASSTSLYSLYACIENVSDTGDSLDGPPLSLGCPSGTSKYIKYSNP